MDEQHLCAAFGYVALNPVRAKLVDRAEEWPWSSVQAQFAQCANDVVRIAPALERVGDFKAFLGEDFDEAFTYAALRKTETLGRPVGSSEWIAAMAVKSGLQLLPRKRRPIPRVKGLSHLSP